MPCNRLATVSVQISPQMAVFLEAPDVLKQWATSYDQGLRVSIIGEQWTLSDGSNSLTFRKGSDTAEMTGDMTTVKEALENALPSLTRVATGVIAKARLMAAGYKVDTSVTKTGAIKMVAVKRK